MDRCELARVMPGSVERRERPDRARSGSVERDAKLASQSFDYLPLRW